MALKKDGDKIPVTMIITKALKEEAEAYGQKYGLPLTAVVRMALVEFLEKNQRS